MDAKKLEAMLAVATTAGAAISAFSPITRQYAHFLYYLGDWDGVSTPTLAILFPSVVCYKVGEAINNSLLKFVGKYAPLAVAFAMSGALLATELGAKIDPIINNTPDPRDIPWLVLASVVSTAFCKVYANNLGNGNSIWS